MEPIFKVGDRVRVKKRIDDKSYKYSFTYDMAQLSGQVFTIEQVVPNNNMSTDYSIPDDCALYRLKEDGRNWSWSSGMLERADGITPISIKSNKQVKLNFNL